VRIIAHTASGKANKATIEVLAGFFGVKKRAVRIIKGKKSREKIIDVSLRYALVGNITEDKRLQKILKNPRKHRKTSQKYIKNVMERGVNQNSLHLVRLNFAPLFFCLKAPSCHFYQTGTSTS
jgi:hypothetical protein